MTRATDAVRAIAHAYGARGLARRIRHELRRRAGRFQLAPAHAVSAASVAPHAFVPDLDRVARGTDAAEAVRRADRVASGEHQAYRDAWVALPSSADAWNRHPATGVAYQADAPWFTVRHLDPAAGDIKDVWEPARFGWAYDLARGYAVTRDERYAEAFWERLEQFLDGCPPFRGVQWSCGQETAIRLVAWAWAYGALARARATTDARRARLLGAVGTSGERIGDAIGYGLSQRNNHGISEAVGLLVAGAWLRGAHPHADAWARRGRALLEELVPDQFGADGWYVQHSFSYLRVALDQLVVARHATAALGADLSAVARARVAAGVRLLLTVMDERDGDVPNHGANDGALVLPVHTAGYRDFRPAALLAAAAYGVAAPAWCRATDEPLAWLGLEAPAVEDDRRSAAPGCVGGASGWAVLRAGATRAFVRAGRYASRPSHLDPAHVDVWVDGRARAIDGGSFRYNAAPPWRNALAALELHNTVAIEGLAAAERGAGFLWLGAPRAAVRACESGAAGATATVANETWRDRGVAHERRIAVRGDAVVVEDRISIAGPTARLVTLHWLLPPDAPPPSVTCSLPARIDAVTAEAGGVRGWHSTHYARREPATSLAASATVLGDVTFVTTFGRHDAPARCDDA